MLPHLLIPALLAALASVPPDGTPGPAASAAHRGATGAQTGGAPPDSADLRARARAAQDAFERMRRRNLPRDPGTGGGSCSEVIGRFCLIYQGEDDWEPTPDPPEILQGREALLRTLTEVGEAIPGDRWVLSQRIFYLAEEGRWSQALELTRRCGGQPDAWWCRALRGLVLHGAERYLASMEAFREALARMDDERAGRWRDPEHVLDDGAWDVWSDADAEDRPRLVNRLWLLGDPLYLVPGNDRLTAHYARHTISWIRDDAANPHRVPWGWDLARILVRYGAELGWERQRPRTTSLQSASVVGHHHPESRQYLPSARAFEAPTELEPGEWTLEEDRPRTAYAPPYAPRTSTPSFQLARFRRQGDLVVVAGFVLPLDTGSGPARPGVGPAGPWGGSVQAGLFLLDPDTGVVGRTGLTGAREGALRLRTEPGAYLASVEVWDPGTARAARSRQGVSMGPPPPPDVAALSDLLLMNAGERTPRSLEEAAPRTRAELRACPGERVTVGWELYGVGLTRESVRFHLRLRRTDRSFLSRAGEWLGLSSGEPPVSLSWTESGPEGLRPYFRAVDLTPPDDAEAGAYELVLEAVPEGRGPLEARQAVRIGGSGCRAPEG